MIITGNVIKVHVFIIFLGYLLDALNPFVIGGLLALGEGEKKGLMNHLTLLVVHKRRLVLCQSHG